jgi:cardiolipin synthase
MSGESQNQRWHEKHLIVDHEVSVEGGMNVGDNYAFGGSGRLIVKPDGTSVDAWRDVDVRLEGPSVIDTQRCFLKNWDHLGGKVSDEEHERFQEGKRAEVQAGERHAGVRVVQHRPFEDGDANTLALYAASIRAAQRSITIESAYFVPTPELKAALLDAAARGVVVRIMTNSETSSDMGFVTAAARFHYQELMAAGVEIFELQGTGTLHAKTATFDGAYSIVGSCNLNGRSEKFDTEVCLAISDEGTAHQLEQRFEQGVQKATRMDLDTVRGDWQRSIKQWALSRVSDLF